MAALTGGICPCRAEAADEQRAVLAGVYQVERAAGGEAYCRDTGRLRLLDGLAEVLVFAGVYEYVHPGEDRRQVGAPAHPE